LPDAEAFGGTGHTDRHSGDRRAALIALTRRDRDRGEQLDAVVDQYGESQ
jgi:hypothetical protein